MTPYQEGYHLGKAHARPDSRLDPRHDMAHHARKGSLDEFMKGFDDGYEAEQEDAHQ